MKLKAKKSIKGIIIMVVISVIVVACVALIPFSKTNYDLTTYLPKDSMTLEGISIMESEFGSHTNIQLQLDDVSSSEAMSIKQSLMSINHVEQVIWLDDYIDLESTPIQFVPRDQLVYFYQDGNALLTIVIGYDSYDLNLDHVIENIKSACSDYTFHLRGEAINNIENRTIANHEVFKIILIIVPILIVILFLASSSWFEPVLILSVLAMAILINYGTNFFIPNVSFITKTMALALQLALSIDYALFLTHRYREERELTDDPKIAIKAAFKKTFPAITASALTTIAGFLSIMFMRYRIGLDIGLVLSKGILLSYLITLIALPILLVWADHLIEKTKHKTFIKAPKWYIPIMNKVKYPMIILLIGVIIFGIIYQQKTTYHYGNNTTFNEHSSVNQDQSIMDDQFGIWHQMVILVPKYQMAEELSLIQSLSTIDHVTAVQSLYTSIDPLTPIDMIPPILLDQFVSDQYERMIITIDIRDEGDDLYLLSDDIMSETSIYYDEFYIIGAPQATTEIKDVVTSDAWLIISLSIIAIFIILALTFKSIFIPILLVGIIQAAIWMNVSLLYFTNITTLYIGYLVVMAIQLGATIDYAVLLTNRYLQNRAELPRIEALHKAFERASVTIFISALILSVAGFIEGGFSDISAIRDIGFLLGKGTLISVLFVYLFIPPALLALDTMLLKTQFHKHIKHKIPMQTKSDPPSR